MSQGNVHKDCAFPMHRDTWRQIATGFMIMPSRLGDAVGLSAIFQPGLAFASEMLIRKKKKKRDVAILPSQECFNGVFLFLAQKLVSPLQ